MRKKILYFFTGFILIVLGLFAYHFYAANSAEQMLDETIQKTSQKAASNLTIDYSSIDINPFTGDILFSDINIIRDQAIQRATSAHFDLSYSDFLNFMLWGTESGLKQVNSGILNLRDISYTDRQTFMEIKVDSLRVDYSGNLWNLIVLGVTNRPPQIQHNWQAFGTRFRFYYPESGVGDISADTLQARSFFGKPEVPSDSLSHKFELSGITWTPPASVQEKYQFFIKGFGYPTDEIPLKRASFRYQPTQTRNLYSIEEITLQSELFTTTLQGYLRLNENEISQSSLQNMTVRIHDISKRFRNFLQQLGKLVGLSVSFEEQQIQAQLNGPLAKPDVTFQNQLNE